MNVLIFAAHPDDETIGMGGTIKKLSKNFRVHLCVVTEGVSAQYNDDKMISIRKKACKDAGRILGISNYNFLEFSDMKLDTIPHLELNKEMEKVVKKINPKIVYTISDHDLNKDHQKVFESTLIATRPQSSRVKQVYGYEIPGPSRNPFNPTVYENIEKEFSRKIVAFKKYKTEIMKFPHPRSLIAIENLAVQRGVESGLKKAEAFRIIRQVND